MHHALSWACGGLGRPQPPALPLLLLLPLLWAEQTHEWVLPGLDVLCPCPRSDKVDASFLERPKRWKAKFLGLYM